MADETLEAKAQALFERDPLVAMLTIVVAGNHLPGARESDVDGKRVMLPDWDMAEWAWWFRACVEIAAAQESARPEGSAPDLVLEALRAQATGMLAGGELRLEGDLDDNDQIGWLALAGRALLIGGRLLAKQGKRVAKWAAPHIKKAAAAGWTATKALFKSAPVKIVTATMLLSQSETATNAVKKAIEWAADMFGHTVKATILGLGPLGLVAAAGLVWYFFFRGRSESSEHTASD